MLTLQGSRDGRGGGIGRRNFLKIGGLSLGGLSLPQVLQAEAQAGAAAQQKSVIMIFLVGGASHIDMFDMKPDAPSEVRGQYKPIDTNVPGIQICDRLPKLAQVMDKLVLLRSLVGGTDHFAHVCLSGYPGPTGKNGSVDWPSFGSMVSKVQGPAKVGVPPFVSLTPQMTYPPWGLAGPPGFLGPAHAPFQPRRRGGDDVLLQDMTLDGMSLDRLSDRKALLSSFDRFRRSVDTSGVMEGMDTYTRNAFDVITSRKLVEALDLEREDPRVRARYGYGSSENVASGACRCMDHFLLARRLVEAGVRVVSLAFGHWDWHSDQYEYLKGDIPPFDQGFSALIEDLYERGLDQDVSVVAWGEMGRTPQINARAGRDHWPQVSTALLSGGGMTTGQVIGATDRLGEGAVDRPVHYQNVFSTFYHKMGINPHTTKVPYERFGQFERLHLLDERDPVPELL